MKVPYLIISFLIFILSGGNSYAQDFKPFEQKRSFYVNGSSIVLGNNILSKNSKRIYNKSNGLNDIVKMVYVDVDNDPETFSSSSSSFKLKTDSQIIYAGLYWAGTYPGIKGVKKKSGRYLKYNIDDQRDQPIDQVLLKINDDDYVNVDGTVIFDGLNSDHEILGLNQPYVTQADVTSIFQNLSDSMTNVTIANIPATQGYINGGSAAGWLLYVVYENDNDPARFITLYDGFEFIEKKEMTISINDFKTTKSVAGSSRVFIAALDGDKKLSKDRLQIVNTQNRNKLFLESSSRPSMNFFNSTISTDKEFNVRRIPASANTLGFDIAQVDIQDQKNEILPENTQSIDLRYSTKQDTFYVFFTAFETIINETFFEEKKESKQITAVSSIKNDGPVKDLNDNLPIKNPVNDNVVIPTTTTTTTTASSVNNIVEEKQVQTAPTVVNEITTPQVNKPTIFESRAYELPQTGYYLITNAFSSPDYLDRWLQVLRKQGYQGKIFLNPDNNLFYVYLDYSQEKSDLQNLLQQLKKNDVLKTSWIKKYN